MSSSQNQSTSAAPNSESTEIQNPHRNRNYRSNTRGAYSGSPGTEETGFHNEQRQTANRRRRHKPRGSNVDEPHTPHSTIVTPEPDAATLRPQSDRTATAGRPPASAHMPSRNRNRLPDGRAVTSQAKPPGSGQSRQWRRSKPADSGSKADAQTPTSGPNSQHRRNK